ncbi:hypothetical protein conserved [Leishmania donovani]|uniref:Uncharacterized protein n=3 Tax=Leishmania donovani species complex TaxID=38574 RepID=A4I099_LEIIN|nr:hypothetical protein LINJ_23_0650 [Leishmania infantum JPCM5]CAC9489334.1 hypothetical_protein_-_conserved [Leishmania infantum]CAJ1988940.1 hypothetical protein conserved [Leishmania donovani]CAM68167.1 hypothetical protein LINJ_23_0650 [Leishmania infantum JPCM5]SUZ41938.1 hypothetical_protein_-_conserved [Leishmania infantum]VDZ44817.1 hypothetical_protein_conserved [Leishmania donovani]|eukprot:XP_001465740.1 hypothetical protein LINJ_23_0650 [Leishmania infantum JPCM5]
MNLLHSIVKVTFGPVTAAEEDPARSPFAPSEKMKVVSRQLLTFRLTVTYDNMAKDASKEQATKRFLSMVGIHSLEAAWSHLFGAVQVVPFLLYKTDSSTRLESEKASSPEQASSPPMPSSASEEWTRCTGSVFVCGTPRFWSSHRYRWSSSDAAAKKSGSTPLHGSTMTELSMPASLFLSTALHSLPMTTVTASPSLANNSRSASGGHGDAYWRSSAGVRCEVIGSVSTVAADEGSPRRLPAEASTAGEGVAVGFTGGALPHFLESRYTIELALPDFEVASLHGVDTALAMVVLLPLCAADGGGAATASAEAGDQPFILRSVLARSVGQTQVEAAAASALVLGSGVIPVQLMEPFLCVSSTSPLSNDRLVLNLSLTNVTSSVAQLYSTSFDLHSSCVLLDAAMTGYDFAGEEHGEPHITASSLWGEMRPGANLSSMRTIDLLTKLVTITPVVVGEERPPVELYPGETYTFEFVIEVLPQLCYLLNSQSLEYLYERHYAMPHGVVGGRGSDGSPSRKRDEGWPRGGGGGSSSAAATFGHGPVVTDCYDQTVSAAELRRILSHSYVSHLFVYYNLAAGDAAGNSSSTRLSPRVSGLAHSSGLCLRYPARWSFAA